MSRALFPKRTAYAASNAAFITSVAFLYYYNWWWPGILLAIWATIGIREVLTGRILDFFISSVILLGLFYLTINKIYWDGAILILFILGSIYLIFKDYFYEDCDSYNRKNK